MKQLPRIYCDMDGVLCDFKKHAEKQLAYQSLNGLTYQSLKSESNQRRQIFLVNYALDGWW